MGNGMNKIMPGLFIGNFRDAKDDEQLKANSISHIVAIHDNPKAAIEEITYKCIDISDSPSVNIGIHFEDCVMFIHEARKSGGNVLVHCVAGVSRSCAICAAYIITLSLVRWSDAILVVRAVRDVVNPNHGFRKHLENYDIVDSKNVRKKLIEKYGEIDEADVEHINSVLVKLKEEASVTDANVNVSLSTRTGQLEAATGGTFASCQRKK
jgi:atypical dual specificity phosphatase